MGVGLSVSIERRVERLKKRSGGGARRSGNLEPVADRESSAMVVDSSKCGDVSILKDAKNLNLENCVLIAGNIVNINVTVPEGVLRKIITWVSLINYQDIQDDNLSKRIGETSAWILEEEFFVGWEAGDEGMLWGTGIPGAGKTILASVVIDHLRRRAKVNPKILVAFAYCRYTDPLPVKAVLAAIIRQILEEYPSTIGFVKPLYDRHELRGTSPTEMELVEVLKAIFTCDMFDQRFLSVDGLDEATSQTQFDILDTLCQLPLNALFTSRPLPLLKDSVPEARFFDIIARDADIERMIDGKVRSMKTLEKLLEQDGWRERVLKAVLEKSSGMFLLASLQLEMLGSCLSIRDLRSALNRLPKGVHAMYAATMERIEQQANPRLAKRTLVWLVHALESMTIHDLRHALAIDPDTSKYDPELLVDAESLVSACCGLVTLEPHTKLVRLVHYTAKDFLEPYLQKDYPEPHVLIASSCVAHLIYRGFQDMKRFVENDYGSPFLGYSHRQWAPHSHLCASVPPDTVNFILRCRRFPIVRKFHQPIQDGSSVHIAAAFDFRLLLREWFHQTQPSGPGPFPHRLDVNIGTERQGYTPLLVATMLGNIETVRDLLGVEGIDICRPNKWDVTPLMAASRIGHLPIVELLLGAVDIGDVNATNQSGWTALMYASLCGHVEVVRAILGFHNTRNGYSTTLDQTVPSDQGISYGAGINVNEVEASGIRTALTIAVQKEHYEVVKELLRVKDISVNRCPSDGSALRHASLRGSTKIVQLLLDHPGIDINISGEVGWTALDWALDSGYEDTAELLRSRGAHKGPKSDGPTPHYNY